MRPRRPDGSVRGGSSGAVIRAALIMAVTVISSCSGTPTAEGLPPTPPVVVVTLNEYEFEYDRTVPAGRVVFRFVNAGRESHRPSLLPLPEDVPPIGEQLRGSERRMSVPFAGIRTLEPGENGTFAVDLRPGQRYALICFATAPDGESHAVKGMSSEFRAQ